MKSLYCPICHSYLEGGDGDMHDCDCGWKQPTYNDYSENEIVDDYTNLKNLVKDYFGAIRLCEEFPDDTRYVNAAINAHLALKEIIGV